MGLVWRVDTRTRKYEPAIKDDETMHFPAWAVTPFGINGLLILNGYLYWSNSYLASVYRIAITKDGYAAPGAHGDLVKRIQSVCLDTFCLRPGDNDIIWGATDADNRLVAVTSDGTATFVAGAPDEMTLAGSVAPGFGTLPGDTDTLYVATSGAMVFPVNGTIIEGGKIVAVDTTGFLPNHSTKESRPVISFGCSSSMGCGKTNLLYGYEGPNLARRHRSNTRRRGRGALTGPPASTTSSTPTDRFPPTHDDSAAAADVVRGNAITLMRRHTSLDGWDEKVSPSLVRKSFRAAQPQLFLEFIGTSFPTLYFHNRFRSGDAPGFAEFIIMNFGKAAYLDSAVCCLSSVYLAHLTQDKALLKASRKMYSRSLSEVIRAIPKAEHANSDNMLCTSIILSVFEMYAQTTPDAWVVHSDGAKRLMISRGPEGVESGFGRSCWIAFRGFFIATSVYEGKPCFLDQKEWQSYATKVRREDSQKSGEWAAYGEISDLAFMEIAKCPRYISETRDLLSASTDPDSHSITNLTRRIDNTSRRLSSLIAELRACISAHSERQQGIIQRPESFVGPVPAIFPDTGPSLLLNGAENMLETLHQLSGRLRDRLRFSSVEEDSPESYVATPPSGGSECSTSPPSATSKSHLPFRIHSELGQGPSRTSDPTDPRAVIWLDRIASSMGVLGTKVLSSDVPSDVPSASV
ncbi:unnamed protein product [Penicillium glandicola]